MKMSSLTAAASILGLALVLSPIANVQAAELQILAGGAMTGPLRELAAPFESASGHTLVFRFRTTPELIKLATTGAFASPWVCCSVRMSAASNCLMHAHCITLMSQTFNWRGDMKFGTIERSDGLLPYVSQLQWRVFRFCQDPEQIYGTP